MATSLLATTLIAGCGPPSEAEVGFTPLARDGQEVFNTSGCSSCHGVDGGGGAGPKLRGVFGRSETLDDGTVVVVDREYLIRSISDPGAQKVEGYSVRMPANDLSIEEIEFVIAYLEELS